MRILVTGSTGMVGSALVRFLATGRHEVIRLVRTPAQPGKSEVHWDPAAGKMDPTGLEGLDAVVHLAGENIAARRWTAAQKLNIRKSRVKGTEFLCETLARLERPPKVLACASAMGYYGHRGHAMLREESAPGTGFLADVCLSWEAASKPLADKGVRVVHLRFGVILSPEGGVLGRMLFPFQMGVGGQVGDGKQYMSWITLDDTVRVIQHVLENDALRGPVNVVAPHAVTNREFTKALGRVLRRPTVFPIPAFAARLAFGEMADALLLASTRIEPARLLASGFKFLHPELEPALRHVLHKPN